MEETENTETFKGWAIIELFGHNAIAGLVSDQTVGGTAFVRVDVPGMDGNPPFTKLFGAKAIYAITPTTEEIATIAARNLEVRPVRPWIVPEMTRPAIAQDWDKPDEDDMDF